MKIKTLIQLTGFSAIFPLVASAATIVWDGGGTGDDFEDGINWDGDSAPTADLTTDIAELIGGTVEITTSRQVGGLDFTTAGTTLSGGNTLTVGTSGISGSQNITLSGGTTLDLNGTDTALTFTGNIEVGSGSSIVSERNALRLTTGSSTITLDGGTIEAANGHLDVSGRNIVLNAGGGTLIHRHARNIYGMASTVISGAGELTLKGENSTSGRVQLEGTNTYTGGTRVIEGGQAWLYNNNSLGADNTSVTLDTGGTLYFANSINLGDRAIILDGSGRFNLNGKTATIGGGAVLSGAGDLTITNGGNVNINSAGNTYSGGTLIDGSQVNLYNGGADALGTGTITLDNGGIIKNRNNNPTVNNDIILGSGGGGLEAGWSGRRLIMNGQISGDGALTIRNDSSTIRLLNTGNTYSGGTEIQGFVNAVGGAFGTGDVTLNDVHGSRGWMQNFNSAAIHSNNLIISANGGRMKAGWSSNLEFQGVVSGTGVLRVEGDSGTVVFSNTANTYTGNIELTNSNSRISVGSLGGGTYAGVISGDGTFEYTGTGTQTLSGANTYTGQTTISGGSVDLGGGTANGSLASSTLNLDNGSLAYTRTGGTTQAFTTTNIVSGSTEISTVAGNTLTLGALNRTAGGVSIGTDGTITTTTSNDGSGIIGGWASYGDDWAVANGGTGITAYSGYTATSSAGMSAGNYASNHIDVDSSEGVIDAVITPNTIRFNDAAANSLTLAAGTNVINSGGILVGSNVGNNLSTITGGDLTGAASSDLIITQNNTSNDLAISSVISDNSGTNLIKSGDGTVNLATAATYTGETIVGAGKLVIQNGVASDNFTVNSGSTLEFNTGSGTQILSTGTISGGGTFVKSGNNDLILGADGEVQNMSMSGGLIHVTGGRLRNDYGNGNWDDNLASLTIDSGASVDLWDSPGGITVDALNGAGNVTRYRYGPSSTNVTVGVNGGGGTFSGTISDDTNFNKYVALVKEGAGEQILSGANTFHGTTIVNAGTLTLSNSLALQNSVLDTGSTVTGDASNGLKTTVTTLTVGGLTGDKDLASVFTTTSGGYDGVTALTLNPNADEHGTHTYTGVIADGAAGMTLTKTGTGTQILSGNNTYTGATTVSAGTLQLQGDAFTNGTRTYSISSGGILNLDGNHQLSSGSNTTINGDGTFLLTGGKLERAANNGSSLNMALGSGALIDIQSGATLQNGGWGAVNWASNLADANVEGTLDVWDGNEVRVDSLTGSGSVNIGIAGSSTQVLSVGVDNGSGTFSGIIENGTGSGRTFNVVKEGTGTQIFTGANTYNGTTTINGGTLQIGDGGTTGSVDGAIVNNSVLAVDRSNTLTLSNDISGTGSVQLTASNGGDSAITGTNTHSGGTTIHSGIFRVATDGNLGATSGTLTLNGGGLKNNDGALTLDAARNVVIDDTNGGRMQAGWSSNITIEGVVSGAGDLTVIGDSGSIVLANTGNTFTGDIILQDSNSVLSAASLGGGAYAGVISGDGTFTWTGDSTFTGTITLAGATTVESGASIGGSGSFAGDLSLAAGATFIFSETDTLTVTGSVTLDGSFGVDDLVGLSAATALGTYVLIDGTATDFSALGIENFGVGNAYDLGSGISAYFQSGSLELVVVPEPGTFALLAGMLALGSVISRRRRRA